MALLIKNLPTIVGDAGDTGLIPGSGRSPGGGHGNPLLYSCLENPMDRGAWWAMVHRVAKSRTCEHTDTHLHNPGKSLFIKIFSIPGGSDGKESACNVGDLGSIPGLGRSPGEGNSYPLQYSGLENSMDRGAWQAIVQGVA